jgi:hypothetical protein
MTTPVSAGGTRRRSLLLTIVLAALATVTTARTAEATHFAYGTLYWQIDPTWPNPNEVKVLVTLEAAFRWSYPFPEGANPAVGTTVTPGELALDSTGAPTGFFNVPLKVQIVNAAEDWFIGSGTLTFVLPKARAPFMVRFENCCRLSDLEEGNNDANFLLRTVIPVGPGFPLRSPRSTSLPRIFAQTNQPLSFLLPTLAYDGMTNQVALAPSTASGLPTPRPIGHPACNTASCWTMCSLSPFVGGICSVGLTVSPAGVVTWTPQVEGHYAIQFAITAYDVNGVPRVTVPLDILLDVEDACNPSVCNVPPTFSPAPPAVVAAITGQPATFTLGLTDLNTDQTVSLLTSPLPAGASISPNPETYQARGTIYTFSWPAAAVGDHVVCFQGLDSAGGVSLGQACTTIQVRNNVAPLAACSAPQIVNATSQSGASATVQVTASDANEIQGLTVSWTVDGSPDGADTIPAGAGGTRSITRTLAAGIVHTISASVSDGLTSTSCSTTVDVRKLPQTIAFSPVGPFTYGHAPVVLTASASSTLPVALQIVSGPGTLSGHTLSLNGAGFIEVKATQAGDGLYNAADPAIISVEVTRAALSVVVQDAFKTEGQPNPPFSAGYATFVNGDTAGSLGGTLLFTTSATMSSPPGTYSVMPGGLTSPNYTITFVPGTLTIGACLAVDSLKPVTSGSALPVKIQPCGTLIAGVTLRAIAVEDAGGNLLPAQDAGNSNADGFFRDTSAFMFNLKTTGLAPGSYSLTYQVIGEPVMRSIPFTVQ